MTVCEYQEKLPEFALGSLDEIDQQAVLDHLRDCPTCPAEARGYLEALQRLALPDELEEPSALLGARLAREIRADVQPAAVSIARRRRWLNWPAVAASVAAVLAVGWAAYMQTQLSAQQATLAQLSRRYDTIVDVLVSPNMQMREMAHTPGAYGVKGRLYIDKDTGNGMVMHNLPALKEGECYQLWFISGGQRVNGGILRTNPDGSGYTLIRTPGPSPAYEAIHITREPAGGSEQPTSDRLLWTGI